MSVISQKYKSDHLFLLVGSNPLPNYVAVNTLLNEDGTVYLVFSSGTRMFREQLEKIIKEKDLTQKVISLEVSEADSVDIYNKIGTQVKKIEGDSVGLHYTGGTKVMAVHAYRAIQANQKQPLPVCTYLGACTYEMKFDQIGTNTPPAQQILTAVQVSLRDLFRLHNIELTPDSGGRTIDLPRAVEKLGKFHSDVKRVKQWREWIKEQFQKAKKTTNPTTFKLTWPTGKIFEPIIQAICDELSLPVGPDIELSQIKEKIKDFEGWLNGKWLEQYTCNQISKIAEASKISDYGFNLQTDRRRSSGTNFEVDVGAMRGYQLFAISCYSGHFSSKAKQKLFEIYVRARQLGGDEARVGLICPIDKPNQRQQDMEQLWNADGKIKVFGAKHFAELDRYLTEWFKTAR